MDGDLTRAIGHAARFLPAQGPITVFIHHNTLHAFEHAAFEDAVVQGGQRFGCEPFLGEERYREELRRGRVRERDLEAVVASALGAGGATSVAGLVEREALHLAWLRHGVPEAGGHSLDWLLRETDVLERLRPDLPAAERARALGSEPTRISEREAVRALWAACRSAVSRCAAPPPRPLPGTHALRHRDLLLATTGMDVDAWVHPLLIRLSAAYLDQGVAMWPMPRRGEGFYRAVARLYGGRFGPPERWISAFGQLLAHDTGAGRTAHASIERSLDELGVPAPEWDDFLAATGLALRGWAGMMRQIEERPDRVPVHAPPATLGDFFAVRLLLERAALAEIVPNALGETMPLSRLREELRGRLPAPASPTIDARAWPVFHVAQLLGCRALDFTSLDTRRVQELLAEIEAFDGTTRRRLLHLAYERRLRHEFYDALLHHAPSRCPHPRFQAVFCIDEREESIRRHLEEFAPTCETFGVAGFFGVAMYYRAVSELHARPLCPVAFRPEHEVEEVAEDGTPGFRGFRSGLRRTWGEIGLGMAVGNRSLVRGTVGTVLLGSFASLPLVLRVLAPRLAARLSQGGRSLLTGGGPRRLALERRDGAGSLGRYRGFTVDEMATIVRRTLEDAGLAGRLEHLVLVVGHGSTSLNNPHESAHDCGACGGGRGGPNARTFVQMANRSDVRALLARTGSPVPDGTWFLAAEHNTANDDIRYFDLDLVPEPWQGLVDEARAALDRARRRDAHERCRRFESASTAQSTRQALAHVEARAEDLAQPRPEYGHATNAFCVVGRRSRTRDLFLDRRAFLVSYDPVQDPDSTVLARVLAAVVPVVAGISLEYYFGYVDPVGYGCGTKLPHNVSALLGVMDGHASDLRTGLPWQMLEVHEPVRLSLVVETSPESLRRVVRENDVLDSLVSNRWIMAAALDPGSATLHEIRGEEFLRHVVETDGLPVSPCSAEWYDGRRGFLGFARIGAPATPGSPR